MSVDMAQGFQITAHGTARAALEERLRASRADFIQRALRFFDTGRLAMPGRYIFHIRDALAFDRVCQNQRGLTFDRLRRFQRVDDLRHVVPIDLDDVPAEGAPLVLDGLDALDVLDEAVDLLTAVETVVIAKGKKSTKFAAAEVKPADLKGPTGNYRSPIIRRSSSRVPSAISWPWSMTPSRSHSSWASSM